MLRKIELKLNLLEDFEFKNMWYKGEGWSLQKDF